MSDEKQAMVPYQIMKSLLLPAERKRDLRPHLRRAVTDEGVWASGFDVHYMRDVGKARAWVDRTPPIAELEIARAEFDDAANRAASHEQIMFLMARAIDAFPQAKLTSVEPYVDAITLAVSFDDEDDEPPPPISEYALTLAIVRLHQRSIFVPSVAEVVTEARKARNEFFAAELHCAHLIEVTKTAMAFLREEGDDLE